VSGADVIAPGRLEAHLRARRDAGRKLLVPYITGGITADWVDLLHAAALAGADAIEVGIPFSDPVMDGPTIQAASLQALRRGTTPASILSDLRAGAGDLEAPLVVMTYANVPFRMGARRFAAELVEAGVSGVILPDVPLEELDEWSPAGDAAGLETVMLASPISPDDRLAALCERSRGFVYGVGLLGVTGERAAVGERTSLLAKRLKAITDRPVVMGFGISTGEQAAQIAADADGVVVGSALMRVVLEGADPEAVGAFVADLRSGLDR
jgi:tryptophan synthase alpha chain